MPLSNALENVDQLLEQRAKQLEQEVAAVQARGSDDPNEVTDRKDEASQRVLAEIGNAEAERDLAELREISLARQRIAANSYGRCVDCGIDIDPRRLLAQPAAARCTRCQTEAERSATRRPALGANRDGSSA